MNQRTFLQLSASLFLILSLTFFQACKQEEIIQEPEEEETFGDFPVEVIPAFGAGETATRSGNLGEGDALESLEWAALSNVACFPMTRAVEFEGNHVFYSVTIPQGAELTATVTPTGEMKRINVYGYIDFNGNNLPPISSCLSCEAGYELYVGEPDLTKPGEPQSISFAQAVNDGFTALIVVAGARDVLDGEYDLLLELSPM